MTDAERKRALNRERNRRYRERNRAAYDERMRKWREDNLDRAREHSRQAARKRRAADPDAARARGREDDARRDREKLRERRRRWAEANRDDTRARQRQWYAEGGCDGVLATNAARRARSKRVLDRKVTLATYDGRCGICGDPVDPVQFDVDHIWPLTVGGPHTYENVQPAHPRCNRRKGAGWVRNGLSLLR